MAPHAPDPPAAADDARAAALALLQSPHQRTSEIRLGLDRVRSVLERLGRPHLRTPAVLVAGTNGKGSTCAFLEAMLRAAGARVGLYTSPHLVDWTERVRVAGDAVSWEVLGHALARVEGARKTVHLTPFELLTAAAFCVFAAQALDAVILEVGLGGRLDATRVALPRLVLVTPIGMDHADRLGGTLESIAREKAGALASGRPALTSASGVPLEVLHERAVARGVPLRQLPAARPGSVAWLGRRICGIESGLMGQHQTENLQLAACAALTMDALGWIRVSDAALRAGAAGVDWPGRLQRLPGEPAVWLDGAHNGAAAQALADAVRAAWPGRRVRFLVGLLSDKDPAAFLAPLRPLASDITFVRPPGPRGRAPESLPPFAPGVPCVVSPVGPAVALATLRAAAAPADIIVATGSLLVVGDILGASGSWSPVRRSC